MIVAAVTIASPRAAEPLRISLGIDVLVSCDAEGRLLISENIQKIMHEQILAQVRS